MYFVPALKPCTSVSVNCVRVYPSNVCERADSAPASVFVCVNLSLMGRLQLHVCACMCVWLT